MPTTHGILARNAATDAWLAVFNGGFLVILTAAGAVLATIQLAATAANQAANGVASLAGVLSAVATGSGDAGKWQLRTSDDSVQLESTDIGYTGQGAALTLNQVGSTAIVEGQTVAVSSSALSAMVEEQA